MSLAPFRSCPCNNTLSIREDDAFRLSTVDIRYLWLEVAGLYLSEKRLWTIFLSVTLATPLVFLLLLVAVWESQHELKAGVSFLYLLF
jgi:hypothetical protein